MSQEFAMNWPGHHYQGNNEDQSLGSHSKLWYGATWNQLGIHIDSRSPALTWTDRLLLPMEKSLRQKFSKPLPCRDIFFYPRARQAFLVVRLHPHTTGKY